MEYTISMQELISRPIIRNDQVEEWLNKMTDEEILQWDKETHDMCLEEGTPNIFPDINAAHLSKHIDRTILYKLLTSNHE